MYRDVIKEYPIEQKVKEITSRENYVTIDNISEYLKDYIVNIEDKRFYKHRGIDIIAIGASFLGNLDVGYFKYGGSTLTQQLAKNLYFSNEKKIMRKIGEMFMAFAIERKYPKSKILELYLNVIYFGNGYYGIKEASEGYFNVLPSELNKYQSSLLVGVPQAPSLYNLKNKESKSMKKRFFQVLDVLEENKRLSKEEVSEFKNIYLTS